MQHKGFKHVNVLYKPEKSMYYVYTKVFDNIDEAREYKLLLINNYNIDSWVMH